MSNDHYQEKPLKICLIAGETSGDMLGGQLMTALNKISNSPIEFSGIGGEKMKEQGLNSFFPISDLSIMGISEILPYIPRLLSRIKETTIKITSGKPDAVVTVTDAHRNPYFNMVEKKPNGEVSLVLDNKGGISRRQDAPIMFDMTTVAYVLDVKFIMNHNHLFEGRIRSVYIPIERSIDIDIDLDFKIAELIIGSRKKNAVK